MLWFAGRVSLVTGRVLDILHAEVFFFVRRGVGSLLVKLLGDTSSSLEEK